MHLYFTLWWQLCQYAVGRGCCYSLEEANGRGLHHMRPLLHWTTENIVFVLFAPCCSSHWISSQKERKRARERKGKRWVSTTCCCFCNSSGNRGACHWLLFMYSKSQCPSHHTCGIPRNTEGKLAGNGRPLKKRGLWTISGYQEKRKTYRLFTDQENKHECVRKKRPR